MRKALQGKPEKRRTTAEAGKVPAGCQFDKLAGIGISDDT